RPVLTPVRVPALYVETRQLPGANAPVLGVAESAVMARAGRVSEMTKLALVSHYVVIVGYDSTGFAIVEPVHGYRTISFGKLARYRRPFADAALVFSGQPSSGRPAPAAHPTPRRGPQN